MDINLFFLNFFW